MGFTCLFYNTYSSKHSSVHYSADTSWVQKVVMVVRITSFIIFRLSSWSINVMTGHGIIVNTSAE